MIHSERERLLDLVRKFCDGLMEVEAFCDAYTVLYNLDIDHEQLDEAEHEAFRDLNVVASRFSPFEEDLKRYNCYYSEAEVRAKALQVLRRLS